MSDVLGYLNGVLHRVSATFMPTEMDDVASFLRGDAWVVATAASASAPQATQSSSTAAIDLSRGASMPTSVRYPLGAICWGHFIPLGIAGTALVSAATSGSRTVLLNFFENRGFAQVFTVSLVPTEQQQQQQSQLCPSMPGAMGGAGSSGGPAVSREGHRYAGLWRTQQAASSSSLSGAGDTTAFRKRTRSNAASSAVVDIPLDSRYSTTAEEARHVCMAAVRSWFEGVEEEALLDSSELRQSEDGRAADGAHYRHEIQLRRLLVIVRCCTDNRVAFSTCGGAAGAAQASSSGTGRRHRRGEDPLYLLLHELAALTTLYEVRLSATCSTVRPAVLLLPEDDSYGGSMLRQQLREEVGHRYWVELFPQPEGASSSSAARHGGTGTADAYRGARKGGGWRARLISCNSSASGAPGGSGSVLRQRQHEQNETPLTRAFRLAAQWGVLELPSAMSSEQMNVGGAVNTSSAGNSSPSMRVGSGGGGGAAEQAPSSITSGLRGVRCMSTQQQEEELRRHTSCFFLRPSNAPLCVFLMEALRRFPVLVRPAVLQYWQSTWTARHSLADVLFAFHTVLCPFVMSASSAEVTGHSEAPLGTKGSSSFPASAMLQDTTDLLDALLSAALTLAEERDAAQPLSVNELTIEQAALFLLFYEALVHQRVGRLRRIPGVVRVLIDLSDRHASATAESGVSDASAAGVPCAGATTDAKVRWAVHHLLPFAPLNRFSERVAQLTAASHTRRDGRREVLPYPMDPIALPIRRLSLAPQLQHSTLLALMPLGESLLELQGAADRVWREELPAYWRRVVAAVSTRDDDTRVHSLPAALRVARDDAGTLTPTQLSATNFYHPLVPHAVRVLYVLTAHALRAPTEAAKQAPIVQLQLICQLSDEQLLLVLKELQVAGLASTNLKTKTARTLLDTM
ncbi:hypothetical protein MNV84_01568 [Leishmania braziliensis]|nr:hypothetical protein MNV84_01568 [Leishmania braziliensis]